MYETNKRKSMISQPMAGRTDEQITEQRNKTIEILESMGYEVIDTWFKDEWHKPENMEKRGVVNIPLCFLAKALGEMSKCEAVYFCKGWESARGCKIEHTVASEYGLEILHEEQLSK